MADQILFKRGASAGIPVLAQGEPGWDYEAKRLVIGDGVTAGGIAVVMEGSDASLGGLVLAGSLELPNNSGINMRLEEGGLRAAITLNTADALTLGHGADITAVNIGGGADVTAVRTQAPLLAQEGATVTGTLLTDTLDSADGLALPVLCEIDADGGITLGTGERLSGKNTDGGTVELISASRFGYAAAYRSLQIGDGSYSYSLGVDLSTIPGGSFSGAGLDLVTKRGAAFRVQNVAGTDFNTPLRLTDGGTGTSPMVDITSSGIDLGGTMRADIYDSFSGAGIAIPDDVDIDGAVTVEGTVAMNNSGYGIRIGSNSSGDGYIQTSDDAVNYTSRLNFKRASGTLYPSAGGVAALGRSSERWTTVFCNALDTSGKITAAAAVPGAFADLAAVQTYLASILN